MSLSASACARVISVSRTPCAASDSAGGSNSIGPSTSNEYTCAPSFAIIEASGRPTTSLRLKRVTVRPASGSPAGRKQPAASTSFRTASGVQGRIAFFVPAASTKRRFS